MTDIIKCTNCSKEVEDSFNYCPYCGNICLTLDKVGLIILKCLNEIKLNAGRSLLSKVLKGSKSRTVFQTKQNENHYFGFFRLYTTKEINALRYGSYSIVSTFPGTSVLSCLKSTQRYSFLFPPP